MAAPLLFFAASTALSMYGQYKGDQAQASILRQQAQANKLESEEIITRLRINNDLIFREAQSFQGRQVASMAASGGGLSSSRMQILLETATLAAQQAKRDSREAYWEASSRLRSARSKDSSARDTETAGAISVLATGIGAGAKGFKATGSGTPKKTE